MSTKLDSSLFVDVADAIGLGNPAIVEKDYYVVQLLKHLSIIEFEHHQLVFTGGTALAKSDIKTYRMSEDIDIKLEFIESDLLDEAESKSIQSIYAEVLKSDIEVKNMACAAILETQAEKLLSMMRRTASVARNHERDDDETLIRHIYDTYHIQKAQPANIESLSKVVTIAIELDVERFGNQHPQMVESPIEELCFGLQLLTDDPKFEKRYNSYVSPMVYAESPVNWDNALAVFTKLANEVLDYVGLSKN